MVLADQPPTLAPLSVSPRWREVKIMTGDYAIIQQRHTVTGKTYYHVLLNPDAAKQCLRVANDLLTEFDFDGKGKRLIPESVHPSQFGITTTLHQTWYLFKYVTKGEFNLESSKTHAISFRCVYFENDRQHGVSLTALKSISLTDFDKAVEQQGDFIEQTVL